MKPAAEIVMDNQIPPNANTAPAMENIKGHLPERALDQYIPQRNTANATSIKGTRKKSETRKGIPRSARPDNAKGIPKQHSAANPAAIQPQSSRLLRSRIVS